MKKEPKNKEAEPHRPLTYSISERYPGVAKDLHVRKRGRHGRIKKKNSAGGLE